MLDASLAEISTLYGLKPESHLVDRECCLTTVHGLAAVHLYVGAACDIIWVGSCLDELTKRGVKGLGSLLRTNTGELVACVSKHQVFLTNYVPGAACDATNIFEVRAIGRLLGDVHRASEDILYFCPQPEGRVSPSWRNGARERAAYWQLAVHKYRQAARGEALRQLLNDAEESLASLEELERIYDGQPVISFAHLSFGKFVYVSEGHTVHLNYAHDCFVEPSFIGLAELLLDSGYTGDTCLHLLAAYQAVHPISDIEWQMLFAYLTYPHEWAQELDDMTRGRPLLKGLTTLEQLQRKREWLDWLSEHLAIVKRMEKGGCVLNSEEKRPEVVPVVEQSPMVEQVEEETADKVEVLEEQVEEVVEPEADKPKASIVWKPFPRPLGSKQEEPPVEETTIVDHEEIPE